MMKKGLITTALSCLLLAVAPTAACSDPAKKGKGDTDGYEKNTAEALERLTRAVKEGDAKTFASMCDYPIPRPYPLRDIEDAATMELYFPVLADDSLRAMMKKVKPGDWEQYGWRGWSFGDNHPIWYDEGVELIPYESAAEKGIRTILSLRELATLKPEYREGWTPVAALRAKDRKPELLRIDVKDGSYRLMGFDSAADTGGDPALLLTGHMHTEGTGDFEIYSFGNNVGDSCIYIPDGEAPERIHFIRKGSKEEETVTVTPCYWRDYVK